MSGAGLVPALGRALQALGANAVPVAGVIGQWWTSGTALALYWIEGVLVIAFMAARIALHRALTHKAGHLSRGAFRARGDRERASPGAGSFLASYLFVAIPFTLVHGVFLGFLLFMLTLNRPELGVTVNLDTLRIGVVGILAFVTVGFVGDLFFIRNQSFRWLEQLTERSLGRIFVLHLTIIFGMAGLAIFDAPMALLGVFAALKALVELGGLFPGKEPGPEPPGWLGWMRRIPSKDGESFDAYWRRTYEAERRRQAANERVVAPRRA